MILSSAWAQRRKATAQIAVLASDGNLNERVAEKRMSKSFELVLSSEFKIQPLPLRQVWVSFAKDTGFREAVICTSRLTWGKKSWVLCGDMLF